MKTSPYLLQHAAIRLNGCVGRRAFEKAKREDKPILVSIAIRRVIGVT